MLRRGNGGRTRLTVPNNPVPKRAREAGSGIRVSSTRVIGFSLIDPWPGSWANNWYDTDDVYFNYVDNGYYLFNRRYPTVGIAVSISM